LSTPGAANWPNTGMATASINVRVNSFVFIVSP
jgi:hypothetical protein